MTDILRGQRFHAATQNDYADRVIYRDDELKSLVRVRVQAEPSFQSGFQPVYRAGLREPRKPGSATTAALSPGVPGDCWRFDKFPGTGARTTTISPTCPQYGDPPPWRFYKNKQGQDLSLYPREELRAAIRLCHQTLWEGGRRSPIEAFGEFSKLVF